MPELPEVTRTAEELSKALSGKYILKVWAHQKYKYPEVQDIPHKTKILNVDSYGKRIIFNLYHSSVGHFRMISFLAMEGHWGWDPQVSHLLVEITLGSIINSPNGKFKIIKADFRKLCFDESRPFGFNKVCYTQSEYDAVFKSVGYDLLKDKDKITPEWWLKQIRNPRLSPDKQICQYLLEQTRFAGVGNYLKSEILYRARIHPARCLSQLTDEEVEDLRILTLRTVEESYLYGGLTISSFYTPDGKPGKFRKIVYDGEGKKDPHGYTIIRETFADNRSSFWVKELQI